MHSKLTQNKKTAISEKKFCSYLPLFQPGTSKFPTPDSNEQLLALILNGSAWERKHGQKQTDLPLEPSATERLHWKVTAPSSTLMLSQKRAILASWRRIKLYL